MKRIASKIFVIFCLSALVVASGDTSARDASTAKKLEVITTLFPTYDFARQVGKDKVNVTLLLPPGIEAHTFEPKPSDIVKINKADIFIYTGKYMEPWVENMIKGVSNNRLLVVDASSGIELMAGGDHDEEGENRNEEDAHGHHHEGIDPHIWLDPVNVEIMTSTIEKAFVQKDPANSLFYAKNAEEYNAKLADLDNRFKAAFAGCKHKTIISGGHFTFGYFTKRYGLEHASPYEGFSPNAEPTPKALAQLIDKLKTSGMKYIYYEELLDPKVARTIASETGARLELLHGAHNVSKDELARGVTYIDIMEDNLKKLKTGLECK